jgi:hypothetical protein
MESLFRIAILQLTMQGPSSWSTSLPTYGSVAVRILIDMTAFVWTLVRAWINGRWPSRRSATGRTLPALASDSAGA